jgi:hypothetical protein
MAHANNGSRQPRSLTSSASGRIRIAASHSFPHSKADTFDLEGIVPAGRSTWNSIGSPRGTLRSGFATAGETHQRVNVVLI